MTGKPTFPLLSRTLLLLGALFVLAGVAWTVWLQLQSDRPAVETDAGAVVVAVTAAPTAVPTTTPSPQPTLTPGSQPRAVEPQSRLSSQFFAQSNRLTPSPTPLPTATPTPLPSDPPTRIVAPAIKLDAKVVPTGWRVVRYGGKSYTEWIVPKNAAGWHNTSAPPGQPGNTVLSGHHNIDGKVFRYVVNLEPGDLITLYAADRTYTYSVTEKYILKEAGMPTSVREKNAQWINPTTDERLTLVTCWPYEWPGNTHRVVVVAKPVTP